MREHLELDSVDDTDTAIRLSTVHRLSTAEDASEAYAWGIEFLDDCTGADVCKVLIASDQLLIPEVSTDRAEGRQHATPVPTSIPGSVLTSGEGCVIDDRKDVRGDVSTAPTADATVDEVAIRHRSMVCAPIPGRGVILALARDPSTFDDTDLELAESIGQILGNLANLIEGDPEAPHDGDPLLEEIGNMVSHDLRNKLNIATGRLDLAIETDDDLHLERCAEALDSVQRIADVVVSLARTGKPLNELSEIDLATAAETAFRPIEEPKAELVVKASATILADADCLSQLLENLFRNAIAHSEETVTIEVGLLEDGFYVSDDGPGIPADIRDEVYDLGFSTAPGHEGKGLSIVLRMADAHGWTVEISESTSGGARFEVGDVVFR